MRPIEREFSIWKQLCAWMVHLYTAFGVVVGVLALLAIERHDFRAAFALMGVALIIDATDGALARLARVKEVLPRVDGARMDDIVDYLNYVLVPCVLMLRADLLPRADATWLVGFPLIASAYGFCQTDAKTDDHYFLGFPSYWNAVAFYFYVLETPLWFNGFTLIFFSILIFVPIKYVYPSRAPILKGLTNALGVLYAISLAVIIYYLPTRLHTLALLSGVYVAYYFVLSFWLNWKQER